VVIELDDLQSAQVLFGQRQENVRYLQRTLEIQVHARGNRLVLDGADRERLDLARHLIDQLYELATHGFNLIPNDIERSLRIIQQDPRARLADIFLDTILLTDRGRAIGPRGPAQKAYVDAMRKHDLVFGVGPAGTGKTYLAMAMALDAFMAKRVKRIILTRPAVEAGEKLGFLPGDLAEKVNPYLRPLRDALNDMMDAERAQQLMETERIEVAPLAFMRGRTLNDSFVILDEAQNTTREQMKMFLTRLGFETKCVVTGDVTQVDLPTNQHSGLAHAIDLLEDVEGIRFCYFSELDVVRHPLVAEIIRAYDRGERAKSEQPNRSG
jgi:phosphate starvation-inducible PhoH-like protein